MSPRKTNTYELCVFIQRLENCFVITGLVHAFEQDEKIKKDVCYSRSRPTTYSQGNLCHVI